MKAQTRQNKQINILFHVVNAISGEQQQSSANARIRAMLLIY